MTNQRVKMAILAVMAAAVTLLSIYLGYARRRSPAANIGSATPMTSGPDASTGTKRVAGSGVRAQIRGFRRTAQGWPRDLAGLHGKVMGEGTQILARYKVGKEGRRLPRFGSAGEDGTGLDP